MFLRTTTSVVVAAVAVALVVTSSAAADQGHGETQAVVDSTALARFWCIAPTQRQRTPHAGRGITYSVHPASGQRQWCSFRRLSAAGP
jgi:hypothetical protein